jgi:glycosyltransferase involved in cell wall biosynthesis
MRILHIVPGTGNFYCQNCIRDQLLSRKLKELGHDIVLMPMYLPFPMEQFPAQANTPVFYDAINLYLSEYFPWYRKAPVWIRTLMNSPAFLKLLAKNPGIMRARGLEGLTISMLQGELGRQAQALERMIAWLRNEGKPDIIHLSNVLLIGLAKRIKEEIKSPIVCSLQDEDQWVDAMPPDCRNKIWEIISGKIQQLDAFISVSDCYSEKMKGRLQIPDSKVYTCYPGIDTEKYKPALPDCSQPAIGFLSRLSESCGLGIFVAAFIILKQKVKFKNLRLKAAGGFTGDDVKFIKGLKKQLAQNNVLGDCEFFTEYDEPARLEFIRGLTLLSVPSKQPEAFGLFQIEAMASRVPVVQPDVLGFSEIINLSEGGVLYSPNTPETLAAAIERLLDNPSKRNELGEKGGLAALKYFSADRMAERTLEIYRKLC